MRSRRPAEAPRASARRYRKLVLVLLLVLAAATAALVVLAQSTGVTPRALAPYLERRSVGHNPVVVAAGEAARDMLMALDRGAGQAPPDVPLTLGAQPGDRGPAAPGSREVEAGTPEQLRRAIAQAEPGDTITLLPGTYRFNATLAVTRAGTAAARLTLRARRPGTVALEFDTTEGFQVAAPYWTFENLVLRGVCADDSVCEHAFHVVGGASHFAAVNNVIVDFNAHFKINGAQGQFPDAGLVDANTLTNTRVRQTPNPVTPIDLVAANGWVVRRNLISDFVKGQGDQISYGAFAKGAGSGNVFEQNLVWCERRLQRLPGQRVGLSLGGGGTGRPYCRDQRCITEQQQGVLRNNLIAGCSDVGIYLNNAAQSQVLHNTVVDTAGITVRFPGSSAELDGNLVDGAIRSRNGGVLRLGDNLDAPTAYAYLGYHPVRWLFARPAALDFAWRDGTPARGGRAAGPDLCGTPPAAAPAYGAFADFSRCLAPLRSSAATSSSSRAN